jgi:uncharacterized membrane protein
MTQDSQSPNLFLEVTPDSQRVERGDAVAFLVTIENRGRTAQSQNLRVNGLADAWCRMEFDSRRRAFPGERRTATLLVTVPRDAEPAFSPFTITARAGSEESTVNCMLEVFGAGVAAAPVAPPPAQVIPPPGVSLNPQQVTWRGAAQGSETVTLTVRNVGAEEATYALALDGLASHWYTLAPEITVPARQAVDTSIVITPPAQARQGSHAYRVSAAMVGNDQVRAETAGELAIVPAGVERQAPQRAVSPVVVEEPEPAAAGGAPAMPPEVSIGPRSTFRFGPGEVTAQATITISNPSRLIERYQVFVRGIDEEWYQLAQNDVSLQPGGSIQVPLRLTPRIGAQFPAGDYSFRVRVAPLRYPDSFGEVAGTLSIAGVASFDARLTPAQTTGRKEKFKLTLVNTGGVPLSPWLEASDPQGMCKFKYDAPSNLEVGQELVVPIWVGSTRQGFAGQTKTFDFRLRVSPAGGGTSQARSFEARFVHQPFLSGRMFLWSILVAVLAAIVGMLFVIGFSSVGRAATAIKCGFDDDYQEFPKGPVLIKQKCDGAPTTLQKGLFTNPNGTVTPGTPGAGTPGARTTGTASPNRTSTPAAAGAGTPAAGECKGDPKLALAVGKPVTLLAEAIRRSTPGTSGQRLPDLGGGRAGGISGGPQCLDGLVWWEVDVNGSKAWTAEQDQNGVRLILDR